MGRQDPKPHTSEAGVKPVSRACMHKRIRDVLVARILDGTYPPGFRFKELSLAREFDVSQGPVREALRELDTLGLVTSEHYRGTRVRGVDIDEMREAYELRGIIEAYAAERAIAYTPGLCEELAVDLESMRRAMESGDSEALSDAALRFHRKLVEASGSRTLLTTWDGFHWDVRARVTLRRIAAHHGDIRQMYALHLAILERLRAGDGRGASAAVRKQFDTFISLLRATQGAPGPVLVGGD